MVKVYCPNCGALYRLPDEKVGIKFRCQKCKQVVFTDAENRLTNPPPEKKTAPTPANVAPVKKTPPVIPAPKKTAPAVAPAKSPPPVIPKLKAAALPPDDEVLYEIDGNDDMASAGGDTTILPDEFIEQLHKSQVESGLVEW